MKPNPKRACEASPGDEMTIEEEIKDNTNDKEPYLLRTIDHQQKKPRETSQQLIIRDLRQSSKTIDNIKGFLTVLDAEPMPTGLAGISIQPTLYIHILLQESSNCFVPLKNENP
jgi:hypothetical protein